MIKTTRAGETAQCHLNNFLLGMVMGEGAVGIPDGSGEGSGFTALRMFALSGGVEHFENLAAMSTVVGGCQDAGPGSIDHGQREGKAELARGQVVAMRRQRDNRAYQVVRSDPGEQFLLHHALVTRRDVMHPHRSL